MSQTCSFIDIYNKYHEDDNNIYNNDNNVNVNFEGQRRDDNVLAVGGIPFCGFGNARERRHI